MAKIDWFYEQIFGFNKNQQKILSILNSQNKAINVSFLSRETNIPRTSIYTDLTSLKERGLLKTRKQGKEFLVKLKKDSFDNLKNKDTDKIDKDILEIKTYKSFDKILNVYREITETHKHQRMFAIQSTETLRVLSKKKNFSSFIQINENIKNNDIIIEGILSDTVFPVYANLLNLNPKLKKRMFESFHGRAADTTLVPEDYLKTPIDIIIINKNIFITNWKDEWAIKINDEKLSQLFLEIFNLIKTTGVKINFTESLIEGWK